MISRSNAKGVRQYGRTPPCCYQNGFTMIELILVIMLIGILSSTGMPRFFDFSVYQNRGFSNEVFSALRYTQKLAIGSGCTVQATITNNAGFALTQHGDTNGNNRCDDDDDYNDSVANYAQNVHNPATSASGYTGTMPDNVGLTSTMSSFRFRPLGDVVDTAGNPVGSITITTGGRSFTIVGRTGLICETTVSC